MSTSLVSIIIPTRNSGKTLNDCLQSLKNQTYKNIELIVIDNNSGDNTAEVAKKFTKKFFIKGPERSAQRNFGAEQAAGKYLLIIDSDMVLSPKVVEECVADMENDNGLSGLIIPEESFGSGFWAQCKKLERSFYLGIDWIESARFFKTKNFITAGGYDEKMVSGEDWDLSNRMKKYGSIGRINSLIYHNEGRTSLKKTIKKKFYYAGQFINYANKNKRGDAFKKQTGVIKRYALFFSKPDQLFKNPLLGLGMLFMKTCEFACGGIGYLSINLNKKNEKYITGKSR
ncbi:MAG: glycosyltransferase [Candidatus Parcubacteria bacterium]|nr:glycosyltransferase [Candidatus Parcubacteria bacterium]